jgi:hypothetical protein
LSGMMIGGGSRGSSGVWRKRRKYTTVTSAIEVNQAKIKIKNSFFLRLLESGYISSYVRKMRRNRYDLHVTCTSPQDSLAEKDGWWI